MDLKVVGRESVSPNATTEVRTMTDPVDPRDLMGGPEFDEEGTDVLGGPETETPETDVLGGRQDAGPSADLLGGPEDAGLGDDVLGGPQARSDVLDDRSE